MKFDEVLHEYTHNGDVHISVTTLLKKYGLSANYTGISPTVLAKAAQRGTAIHKELELYIKGGSNLASVSTEVQLVDTYVKTRGIDLTTAQSEQIVFDTKYKVAGTVDFVYTDGNERIIADFKTTSSLHIDAVSWQLSIYNYLLCAGDIVKYYFHNLKVFHLRNGKLHVKDIATISYDEVEALLEANLKGDPTYVYVKPNNIVLPSQTKLLVQLENEIKQHSETLATLKAERDKMLETVKNNFVLNKQYTYDGPDLRMKYVASQHRTSWDNKKVEAFLVAQNQDIDQYKKTTITKDSVKVTLR